MSTPENVDVMRARSSKTIVAGSYYFLKFLLIAGTDIWESRNTCRIAKVYLKLFDHPETRFGIEIAWN